MRGKSFDRLAGYVYDELIALHALFGPKFIAGIQSSKYCSLSEAGKKLINIFEMHQLPGAVGAENRRDIM